MRLDLGGRPLRVAIFSQHFDAFFPPSETSVGQCSRGLATALAKTCTVRVYGLGTGYGSSRKICAQGVDYRILRKTLADTTLFQVLKRSGAVNKYFNRGMEMPISTSPSAYPFFGDMVARDIASDPVDIVLVQHNATRVATLKRRNPRTPVILHLHAKLLPQDLSSRYRRSLGMADAISGVSAFIANDVKSQLDRDTLVIRNGVDGVAAGAHKTGAQNTGATKTADRPPKKTVLFVGAVSPEKGLHDLIDAFNEICRGRSDVELKIVGGGARPFSVVFPQANDAMIATLRPYFQGDYLEMLRARLSTEAKAHVQFLGHISSRQELSDQMVRATVLAFPSICDEGFGLPPVEAMAVGLPSVVTRAGALPEVVEHGITGIVVEKAKPKALAQALTQLLDDDETAARMGAAARERALSTYTWDLAAEDFLTAAERLIRPRSTA